MQFTVIALSDALIALIRVNQKLINKKLHKPINSQPRNINKMFFDIIKISMLAVNNCITDRNLIRRGSSDMYSQENRIINAEIMIITVSITFVGASREKDHENSI